MTVVKNDFLKLTQVLLELPRPVMIMLQVFARGLLIVVLVQRLQPWSNRVRIKSTIWSDVV